MARELPPNWKCPKCGKQKPATWHHICPGSLFKFVPQRPLCQGCHSGLHDIIKQKMAANANQPLPVKTYFEIWEDYTGQNIEDIYNRYKDKTRLRTRAEMKKKKKKKKNRTKSESEK